MVRCFIAIEFNNSEVIREIRRVQESLVSTEANLNPVKVENLHLTLKFLGEIEQYKVDEVVDILKEVSFEPFRFKLEVVGVFPNLKRPATIWAGITEGVSEITIVFDDIDLKLSKHGFERERKKFHPHLTICRIRSGKNRDQLIEELHRQEKHVFGMINVDRVVLKKSVLTPRGPVYTTLAESHHS